jgi:hypothetical protein
MRNSVSLFLVFSILFIRGIFQQVQAQDKKLEFNLNVGAFKGKHSTIFTLGEGFDYHLGKYFMISPELQLWRAHDALFLDPGAVLNFTDGNFFVGGGVIGLFSVSGSENLDMEFVSAKINAGFRINRIKLTIYLITSFEDLFEDILFGGSIGIVF